MKKIVYFLSLLVSCSVLAQTPVQQSMLVYLSNFPAGPSSLYEIRTKCYDPNTGGCTTEKVAGSLPKTIGTTINQISQTNPAQAAMPDTAGVAAVQKMTPEQQREWAMKYAANQQAMATTHLVLPTPQEIALNEEYVKLSGTEVAFQDSINRAFDQMLNEHQLKLEHFAKQREEMIDVCPKINAYGLESGADPECVKKAERNYREWLANWAAEWFQKVNAFVSAKRNAMRARYGKAENMLMQNAYFLNPTNESYRKNAAGVQLLILESEAHLLGVIDKMWERGCGMNYLLKDSYERVGEKF
jgi:hypothetical protein